MDALCLSAVRVTQRPRTTGAYQEQASQRAALTHPAKAPPQATHMPAAVGSSSNAGDGTDHGPDAGAGRRSQAPRTAKFIGTSIPQRDYLEYYTSPVTPLCLSYRACYYTRPHCTIEEQTRQSLTMSYQFIISKRLDPIFAVSIGLAAAVTRINREEREKGRSTTQSVDVLKRRWNLAWQDDKKL